MIFPSKQNQSQIAEKPVEGKSFSSNPNVLVSSSSEQIGVQELSWWRALSRCCLAVHACCGRVRDAVFSRTVYNGFGKHSLTLQGN